MDEGQPMHFMERYGRKIQLGITLAAGMVLMATALRPQMPTGIPAVGLVWEYAAISGSAVDARLAICYAETNGCRRESADSRPLGDAMMSAAAKLGEKGWELTAATEVPGDNRHDRILYFKRLKSVLNRSESR
jgi:hypothetical protein